MKNSTNFSFDVGMTSLGVVVNKNGEIIHGEMAYAGEHHQF